MSGTETPEEICTIRIELVASDPKIWREVEVPTAISLAILHEIVQAAMGWQNYHLWEFTTGGERYGKLTDDDWGMTPVIPAAKTKLRDVLKPGKTKMVYLYDFGDSWEHVLTVTKVRNAEPGVAYPRYVAGAHTAPPEDCGGTPGFYRMLGIIADPSHPEHEEIKEWVGDFDPDQFDPLPHQRAVAQYAPRRRTAAKAKPAKARREPAAGGE